LIPWIKNEKIIGYAKKVESHKNVWLMLHGNAGQASDRLYVIPRFTSEDSIFILEYPGYGDREGVPSKESFNQAAKEGYLFLRRTYPNIPICVVGESIGSGPASFLASLSQKPDKLVLIVPFASLSLVAKDYFPSILVNLILKDNWDNIKALSGFKGPLEIFGAKADTVIPVRHAKALAAAFAGSKLTIIHGGHNDWAHNDQVRIRNP
jgi:pimeloyl-ACP methyl ester carboxylesterase